MAVVRPELTVEEISWVVRVLDGTETVPPRIGRGDVHFRALRELRRVERKGLDVQAWEKQDLARRRAAMRTAPPV